MTSQLVTWAIAVVGTVVIPRYLGADLIGQLHLATSLWGIATVVISLGMDLALTKAVARTPESSRSILLASLAIRAIMITPVTAALLAYSFAAGYDTPIIRLIAIVGLGAVVLAMGDAISAVLKGMDRMTALSIAAIVGRFVAVAGALVLLALGFGIYAVALVAGVGNLLSLFVLYRAYRMAWRSMTLDGDTAFPTSDPVTFPAIRALVQESLPYFWIALVISLYLQIDTVIISLVVEDNEVLGWYSVSDRLGAMMMFVPTVFMTAVFPTLTRIYDSTGSGDRDAHNHLTEKTFQVMLLISVPIGFGLLVTAQPLVVLLYGSDFTNAGPVVAVGGFVTTLNYLTTVLGMFLISMDRQRPWTLFIALGAALTIPLDLVLVPVFQSAFDNGAIGGVVAYLITEAVMVAGAIYLLPKGALGASSASFTIRAVAAGSLMALVVYPFRNQFIAVPIVLGIVAYIIAVVGLRLVDKSDRQLIAASLPTMKASGRR